MIRRLRFRRFLLELVALPMERSVGLYWRHRPNWSQAVFLLQWMPCHGGKLELRKEPQKDAYRYKLITPRGSLRFYADPTITTR